MFGRLILETKFDQIKTRSAVSVLFLSFTEVYSLTMIVKDDVHIYADISTTHKSEVSKKAIRIDPLTTGYSTDPNKRMG